MVDTLRRIQGGSLVLRGLQLRSEPWALVDGLPWNSQICYIKFGQELKACQIIRIKCLYTLIILFEASLFLSDSVRADIMWNRYQPIYSRTRFGRTPIDHKNVVSQEGWSLVAGDRLKYVDMYIGPLIRVWGFSCHWWLLSWHWSRKVVFTVHTCEFSSSCSSFSSNTMYFHLTLQLLNNQYATNTFRFKPPLSILNVNPDIFLNVL